MSISLILIAVISLIVIAGTAYLLISKNQQLGEAKKGNILLIVGVVIFVSFVVTSMKHPSLHRMHSHSGGDYDLQSIFFPKGCAFGQEIKHSTDFEIPNDAIDEIYARNYIPVTKRPHIEDDSQSQARQNILFLSKKDEGATYFLSELAHASCRSEHPTLYFKLSQDIKNDKEFAKIAGFNSYDQFEESICSLSGIQVKKDEKGSHFIESFKPKKFPYVMIDNFEHLINALSTEIYSEHLHFSGQDEEFSQSTKQYITKDRLVTKMIANVMGKCKVNFIWNSESEQAIEELLLIWEESLKSGQFDLFPFQFHEWQGLKRYDIYKIIIKAVPNSDYILNKILEGNKKERYTFSDLNNIIREIQRTIHLNNEEKNVLKRQDASLRQISMKASVARYFGLAKAYKEIRSSQVKTISFLKGKVAMKELWRLQKLNLITIRNGNVCIQ